MILYKNNFICVEQPLVIMIHNNLLEISEGTAILFMHRKWSDFFDCRFYNESHFFSKDTTLNLATAQRPLTFKTEMSLQNPL